MKARMIFAICGLALYASTAHAENENEIYASLSNGTPACKAAITAVRSGGAADGDAAHANGRRKLTLVMQAIHDLQDDGSGNHYTRETYDRFIDAIEDSIAANNAFNEAADRHVERWMALGKACGQQERANARIAGLFEQQTGINEVTSDLREFLLKVEPLAPQD